MSETAGTAATSPGSSASPPTETAGTGAAAGSETSVAPATPTDPAFPTSGLMEKRVPTKLAPHAPTSAPTPASEAAAAKFRAIRTKRLGRKSLAQAIRDLITPEEQARWLLSFSQGLDPDRPDDNSFARPTMAERLKARVVLIEMAFGTAPQRIQIEAELRATTGALDGDFSRFSDDELAQYRQLARKALKAGTRAAIDAESRERRADEQEHDDVEAVAR